MIDAIRPLIDNGIINEDTRQAIVEAWEARIVEAKEAARNELRDEFASRYQHDKAVMVEAMDKLVTESLHSELSEFASEKAQLAEDRVKFKKHMMENAKKFNDFMVTKLSEEISDLRSDRKLFESKNATLEKFVVRALSEEIKDFETDKRDLTETKVRLISEGKKSLQEMQKTFIQKSALAVQEAVENSLGSELSQLKEDIQLARENMFGRRLFEAFQTEFAVTHLNENKEIRKLQDKLDSTNKKLDESKTKLESKTVLAESAERELRHAKANGVRQEMLRELLSPLNKDKGAVMASLLEGVQTAKLQGAYAKYLPSVLNNGIAQNKSEYLSESRKEVTGNKAAVVESSESGIGSVSEIKRLAGLI